jgi:hypothetical protein
LPEDISSGTISVTAGRTTVRHRRCVVPSPKEDLPYAERAKPPAKPGVPAWAWLVAGVGVLIGVAGIAVAVAVVVFRPAERRAVEATEAVTRAKAAVTGPSPEVEGVKWTERQLAEFLRSKGVPVIQGNIKGTVVFALSEDALEHGRNVQLAGGSHRQEGVVDVYRFDTAQRARDIEGKEPPGAPFAWGRFYFDGRDSAYLGKIKASLK